MTTVGLATRRCSKCSEERPVEDFPTRADRPGHRRSECRTCINARVRAYTRRRYSEDPEFAAARRAEAKRYRDSQKGRDRKRRYYRDHRDEIRAYFRPRPGDVPIDRDAIHRRDKGVCWLCGEDAGPRFQLDHVVPRSLDGPNTPENLRVACPWCNMARPNNSLHVTFHGPDARA